MNVKEIVKKLCEDYETNQVEIAQALGVKSSSLSRSLNGNMKLSTFVKIIEEIGAQVIVQTDSEDYVVGIKKLT